MELEIYAIYDEAAKAYAKPFFIQNEQMAIRAFADETNNTESSINKHPEQYILFKLGIYNDAKGSINPEQKNICRATEVKMPETKDELKTIIEEFNVMLKEAKTITELPKLQGVK